MLSEVNYQRRCHRARFALFCVAVQTTYLIVKMKPLWTTTVVVVPKRSATCSLSVLFLTCQFRAIFFLEQYLFVIDLFNRFLNLDLRLMLIPALPRPGCRYARRLPFILEHFKLGTKNEIAFYRNNSNRLVRNWRVLNIIDILPGDRTQTN